MDKPEFRFTFPVAVRFKDVDIGGHAHHSHALVYFEEARAAYWERITGVSGADGVDYILAEIQVRYHARILWPQQLQVGVRVSRLTRKTFEMEYEVRIEDGGVAASGRSVQVMYDYEDQRTAAVPEVYAEAIAELEGWTGGSPAAGLDSTEPGPTDA